MLPHLQEFKLLPTVTVQVFCRVGCSIQTTGIAWLKDNTSHKYSRDQCSQYFEHLHFIQCKYKS